MLRKNISGTYLAREVLQAMDIALGQEAFSKWLNSFD